MKQIIAVVIGLAIISSVGCSISSSKRKDKKMTKSAYEEETYGFDMAFFKAHNLNCLELTDGTGAGVLVSPELQGRVMTSTVNGPSGNSFGWINYDLFKSGKLNEQFNPFGGEERFWLGPEGGPFSIYFKEGAEQVFENWKVPAVIDTEPFDVKKQTKGSVTFEKNMQVVNASGFKFEVGIERTISLMSIDQLESELKMEIPDESVNVVVYQSENKITNVGNQAWTKENGLLSIWLLCMFNPSPTTTVFIPFKEEGDGVVVNDEYFGKVPANRLIVEEGMVYFKIDGEYRSKIGIPPFRAKEICGSYDSKKKVLTLLWCSLPDEPKEYVNSNWGDQEDPYSGDAVNSYNDGPVDGKIMGPFYEIETSSPAADLQPGQSLVHKQRVIHIQGEESELTKILQYVINVDIETIKSNF
ncbi:DUF6786 family protein [uncultured Sunxiuqinia sp.]|uniref:DUF6786 family protein n=1 Tax=uncultured Sunxiuqinia sp. TaxID=1573825 RepID=UPI002AA7665A|nr:DUF6786 family protein [uncultured Sunxiuqinia sp.]